MKSAAAIALVALLGAAPSGSPATLHGTNMSFKQAMATCAGTLGSVTFALGHTRIQAASGVDTDVDEGTAGSQTITFTGPNGSAVAKVDPAQRTVSAKHLTIKGNGSVACISPD